jgi:hypothetical protein
VVYYFAGRDEMQAVRDAHMSDYRIFIHRQETVGTTLGNTTVVDRRRRAGQTHQIERSHDSGFTWRGVIHRRGEIFL